MEDFNSDPKPGRLILPLVLIGMIATTYTFVRSIEEEPVVDQTATEESIIEEEVAPVTEETTTTTTTIPREVLEYIEELDSEKASIDALGKKVTEANARWDAKEVTYQEAQEEFKDNIAAAEQFVKNISVPGPPDSNIELLQEHSNLVSLADTIYQDTQEIFEGLMASDTGERRSTAIQTFNTNIEKLKKMITLLVSQVTNG